MKRASDDSEPVTQRISSIALALVAASNLLLSAQPAYADLTGAPTYATKWVLPRQKKNFTSFNDKVRAKLMLDQKVFDEGTANTNATLTILRNKKFAKTDRILSQKGIADIVTVNGPVLAAIGDQDEPAIEVAVQTYQTHKYHEYGWEGDEKGYVKREPSIDIGDIGTQTSAKNIWGSSIGTAGSIKATLSWQQEFGNRGCINPKLTVKRGSRTLLEEAVTPPAPNEERVDTTPECSGPFVTNQIASNKRTMIDLRVYRVIHHAMCACEMIYFYDRPSKKLKLYTHEWGLNYPRLASLRADKQIQFVTEDWNLSKPDMGGPIQIWQWGAGNKLHNVTKQFPEEIRKHSKAALVAWNKNKTMGSLRAYVGDLCLLNQKEFAEKELHRLNQATESTDKLTNQLKTAGYW